jgi:hypothetical protein
VSLEMFAFQIARVVDTVSKPLKAPGYQYIIPTGFNLFEQMDYEPASPAQHRTIMISQRQRFKISSKLFQRRHQPTNYFNVNT